jgi:hypothetical protein
MIDTDVLTVNSLQCTDAIHKKMEVSIMKEIQDRKSHHYLITIYICGDL